MSEPDLSKEQIRDICSNDDTFKIEMLERVVRMDTQLRDVVGNGQPGSLARLGARVRLHERIVWMGLGMVTLLSAVVGILKVF